MTIIDVELQAVSGGLTLAKRTLDDVLARVTINPGPGQNPTDIALIAAILATAQVITTEAQQIQGIINPTGGSVPGTASSIEVKKDVQYLDADARARLAQETLSMKLATYKYKNPADGAADRPRLGFILEDSPNVPAADMASKQVDLYAYTSMVLATVQEQQKRIAALEAEVARLKK